MDMMTLYRKTFW